MCDCAARRRCGRLVPEKSSKGVFRNDTMRDAVPITLEMKRATIHLAPLLSAVMLLDPGMAGLCAAMLLAPGIAGSSREPAACAVELRMPGELTQPGVSADRTGFLQTSDGLTLRLTTELGSVKIVPLENGSAPVVRYAVHIETDARAPQAQRLLDRYSLSAKSTPAGVEITGNLPPQLAHFSGAQFWVQFEIAVPRNYSVEGKTEAGDIETGYIGGIAMLTTQGGNIRAGGIGIGNMRNATAERGGARLEREGGHIQVKDDAGELRALTAGGTITAWINPDAPSSGGTVHLPGLSQLTSGNGDIVVFLPRNLAVDIDAVVESGGERRIEADAALGLQIQDGGNGPVHAMGALNGGGPPLKLRTTAGKIRLQFLDSEIVLRPSLIPQQGE